VCVDCWERNNKYKEQPEVTELGKKKRSGKEKIQGKGKTNG